MAGERLVRPQDEGGKRIQGVRGAHTHTERESKVYRVTHTETMKGPVLCSSQTWPRQMEHLRKGRLPCSIIESH